MHRSLFAFFLLPILSLAWSPSPLLTVRTHSLKRTTAFDAHTSRILSSQATQVDNDTEPSPAMQQPVAWDQAELLQKALNGLFLAACFGGVLYTILNIDHGMTRGWTQSEIAMRIPMDTWSSYESALSSKPVATKTTISVVIYLLGDWLSQTLFQKKNILDFDIQRTLKNGFIGLCFGPLVHQYYEWSDTILPVEAGLYNRAAKVVMDQTLYLVIKCSMYISAVGFLAGDDVETVQNSVKTRIGPIVLTAWRFWPLVHCITYSVIPARHRILWVNSVDLIWNAILATQATKKLPEDGTLEDGEDARDKEDDKDQLSHAANSEPRVVLPDENDTELLKAIVDSSVTETRRLENPSFAFASDNNSEITLESAEYASVGNVTRFATTN